MTLRSIFRCVLLLSLTLAPLALAAQKTTGSLRLGEGTAGLITGNLSFKPEAKRDAALSQRIELPEYEAYCWFAAPSPRWPSEVNQCLPWAGHNLAELTRGGQNPIGGTPDRHSQIAFFQLKGGRCLVLLPVPGKSCISWLKAGENGEVLLETGTLGTTAVKEKEAPRLCWGVGANIYEACRRAWQQALACENLATETAPRIRKTYPEMFRYLGWCSWEQYKKNISMNLLLDVASRIKKSPLPIRWILVDDGFQQQQNLKLKSFSPNPRTFPNGWGPIMAQKDAKIRWIGIWHCYYGLWNGIDPNNDLGAKLNKGFVRRGAALYPGATASAAEDFYKAFMGSVRQAGFDFVKIDVQSAYLKSVAGDGNPARMNAQTSQALEEACRGQKLALINCMAHGPMNMFHTRYSAVTRCSIDYHLGKAADAKSHIYQSYANTVWLGQTVWPDHDMFHSSDPFCGRLMAVSKALSGGPVYLSDAPENFKEDDIMPLCRSTGEIYRPLAPAVPLPDSVFGNPFSSGRPYRVIAPLPNGAAAVAAYNLSQSGGNMTATLSGADYRSAAALLSPTEKKDWLPAGEGLVCFDFYDQKGAQLNKEYSAELNGFSDRLLLVAPILSNWAVVGRADKYLSPCAVKQGIRYSDKELALTLDESGPLVVWSGSGAPTSSDGTKAESLGNNFWKFSYPVEAAPRSVILRR